MWNEGGENIQGYQYRGETMEVRPTPIQCQLVVWSGLQPHQLASSTEMQTEPKTLLGVEASRNVEGTSYTHAHGAHDPRHR